MSSHYRRVLKDIGVQELVRQQLMIDKLKIEQVKRKFQDRQKTPIKPQYKAKDLEMTQRSLPRYTQFICFALS